MLCLHHSAELSKALMKPDIPLVLFQSSCLAMARKSKGKHRNEQLVKRCRSNKTIKKWENYVSSISKVFYSTLYSMSSTIL